MAQPKISHCRRRFGGGGPAALLITINILLSIIGNAKSSADADGAAADTAPAPTQTANKAHSSVVDLNPNNFDAELSDPANGLWLLKFFAPWCGHCKQLAPVLDKIAPYLQGTMAIGKVDCTKHKKLCKRFDVKGYPTLKIYRDGDYYMYPGKRDADSIIEFAEKMAANAVSVVSSYEEALEKVAAKGTDGVGFVAYDPDAKGDTVDELVQSTKLLQVFQQVARKMQADASFGLLSPDAAAGEGAKFGATEDKKMKNGAFLAKIERDVDSKFYNPPHEMYTTELLKYVGEHNVALVTNLGPHNFKLLGDRQMPVAIAVTDPENQAKSEALVAEVRKFAKTGKSAVRYKYLYAKMDGRKWGKFLSQFGIEGENLPELFVLNISDRKYWQDASVPGVEEFLTAVANREIEEREQTAPEGGSLKQLEQMFLKHMPWSLYGCLFLFFASLWFFLPGSELEAATGEKGEGKKALEESKKEK